MNNVLDSNQSTKPTTAIHHKIKQNLHNTTPQQNIGFERGRVSIETQLYVEYSVAQVVHPVLLIEMTLLGGRTVSHTRLSLPF